MAYIRQHEKGAIHFLTNRTEHEMLLLLPLPAILTIITHWFVKAVARYGQGLDIFAVNFLGNHFHIAVRDNGGNIGRFMCYMQANIAKSINKHLGRKGKFWAGHYDDMVVEGEASFLNRLAYTLCNSVKPGLTRRAEEWQGFNVLEQLKTGETIEVKVFNATKYLKAKRNRKHKPDKAKFYETFSFKPVVPPMWQGLDQRQIAANIEEQVKAQEKIFHEQRQNKPALGMKKILQQKPTDRPRHSTFSPRVRFMADTKERLKELLDNYRAHNGIYRETWHNVQKANRKRTRPVVEWPRWSYPPSSWIPIGFEEAA